MVSTVVFAPAEVFARLQLDFVAAAVDVVQENEPGAVAEVGVGVRSDGGTAAYLTTHHHGVVEVPVVIAHRAPVSLVVDLNSALAGVPPIH